MRMKSRSRASTGPQGTTGRRPMGGSAAFPWPTLRSRSILIPSGHKDMSDPPVPPRTNRRLASRTACRLTARYRTGKEWRGATAMDLSTRGCRLRVGEDLDRGGTVSVAFEGEGAPPVGPRLSLIPTLLMIVLALVVAGTIFVGFRVLFALGPPTSLGAPFDLVGRNRPLVVDVKDRAGLKSLRATVTQGDKEQVIVDETYDPPRNEAQIKWSPAQDPKIRLKDGPGKLTVTARNVSWGGFFK